jgi:hypothetical protein
MDKLVFTSLSENLFDSLSCSMRKFLLLWLGIFLAQVGLSQGVLRGTIRSGATGLPLAGAEVRTGNLNVRTDTDGAFELVPLPDEPIEFSMSGYHSIKTDQVHFVAHRGGPIFLSPKPAIEGLARNLEQETIRSVDFEQVADYTFVGDVLFILSYMKRDMGVRNTAKSFQNCALTAYRNGLQMHREILPDYAMGLRHLPWGQLFVEGENFAREVKLEGKTFTLVDVPYELFLDRVLPATSLIDRTLFYAYIIPELPMVMHFAIGTDGTNRREIRRVINESYFDRVDQDYTMLDRIQRQDADQLSKDYEVPAKLFAPYLRSLQLDIDLTKPYAPAFSSGNMLLILDPMNNWIYQHDSEGKAIKTIPFYTQFEPEKLVEFIKDRETEKFYMIHERNGVHHLRPFDPESGAIGEAVRINLPFASDIQVWNGEIYFTARKGKESWSLYRQELPLNLSSLSD